MRIAIVNDMPLAIAGLSLIIDKSAEHELAWVAANGRQAIEVCKHDLPDLILMDVMMPEVGGVQATRQIMQQTPCPILIVTASIHRHSDLVFEAMCAGAMDAVITPRMYPEIQAEDASVLLHKIHMIDVLTRDSRPLKPRVNIQLQESPAPNYYNHLVVIGSSSGGPEALARVFADVPCNLAASFVVIQHVDPQFAPGLARWLDERTALSVVLAQQDKAPIAGNVYIACGNNHLILNRKGLFEYVEGALETFYRPSVDVFFASVAQNWRGQVTAILLTGMGQDGARGLLDLRRSGARTIAQDRSSSAVYGMPKAAAEIGAAQEIKSITQIAELLATGFPANTAKWS